MNLRRRISNMKNIIIAATVAFVFYSCQNREQQSNTEINTAATEAVETAEPAENIDSSADKKLKYHWSDDSYSQAHLDSLYILAKFYIAHSANELIKTAVKQNEQLEYSIEKRNHKNKNYDVLGIGHTSENRFTVMQWVYIDADTRKIYEYDLPNDQLIEFPNQPMDNEALVFPETAGKAKDFLPKNGNYEIQYGERGDLNNDGLEDIVMVLSHKEDKMESRPMLILLKDKNGNYRLDKVSYHVMPIEFTTDDYKIYDPEDISIDSGVLRIQLYSYGPYGNVFSTFRYEGADLLLTDIETYNTGAGSHLRLYYDVKQGTLEEEVINTMKEDMPSETQTFHVGEAKYRFEDAAPNDIIIEAYKQSDGN